VFAEHEKTCAKGGGCNALSRTVAFDFDVIKYLQELRRTLAYVPPISVGPLESLHRAKDYNGLIRLIKKAMNIEDVTFVVHWVPDGAANTGPHKDAPAWVRLPLEMPFYGTDAFKKMKIKMYFRKSFFEQAYDEAAVIVAHEFSHVVLESIRHPLRKCEKVVDLTAMLLGFRRLCESACYKEHQWGNRIETKTLGYLSREEVRRASRTLAQEHRQTSRRPWPSPRAWIARNKRVIVCVALIALVGAAPTYYVWRLHHTLLAEQAMLQPQLPKKVSGTVSLIEVRVGLMNFTSVYRLAVPARNIDFAALERDVKNRLCASDIKANVSSGATYKYEYWDNAGSRVGAFEVASCP
jgi:hypothetical protein